MLKGDQKISTFISVKLLSYHSPTLVAEYGDVHVGEEQLVADGLALWQHHLHHGLLEEAGLLAGGGASLLQVFGGGSEG